MSLKGWSNYRPRNLSSDSPQEDKSATSLLLVYQPSSY